MEYPAVHAEDLRFAYVADEYVFGDLAITADASALTCVTGPSGSGKTTLLYALAGVIRATGSVRLLGQVLPASARLRARLRRQRCGFVFQRGELLAELTVAENVALPLRLAGLPRVEAHQRSLQSLARFGIESCADRDPSAISGGQAQRASVARALITGPAIVFADEPTGSLDSVSRNVVIDALRASAMDGAAVIVATHDPVLIETADQVIDLDAVVLVDRRG